MRSTCYLVLHPPLFVVIGNHEQFAQFSVQYPASSVSQVSRPSNFFESGSNFTFRHYHSSAHRSDICCDSTPVQIKPGTLVTSLCCSSTFATSCLFPHELESIFLSRSDFFQIQDLFRRVHLIPVHVLVSIPSRSSF